MDNIIELARECVRLWPSVSDLNGAALAECRRLDRHGLPSQHFGYFVGPIRHAVEVECDRRGWSIEWCKYAGNQWTCRIAKRTSEFTWKTKAYLDENASALKTALLALKWLLDNPWEG